MNGEKMTKLELHLLETLSFYTPMTFEYILIDLDAEKLMEERQLTYQDLLDTLKALEKRKLLKGKGKDKARTWIRVMTKRPWYKRLFQGLFK
jgi:DNA-binding MarR family transcriptional regulator